MTDFSHQPGPAVHHWEWQLQGLCRRAGSELFFHPENERGPRRADREAAAKQICQQCPVLLRCREHALATREPYGVWGGLAAHEREALLRGRTLPEPDATAHRGDRPLMCTTG